MKNITKIASGLTAAVATVAMPVSVFAWGDNGGGRQSYTIDQINNGVLGNSIVLNSISDNPNIGDEKNFVGAREDTGVNAGINNVWKDSIKVEDGKTYLVRMYIHNNSPLGDKAMATGVKASFNVPNKSGKSVEVNGFIDTDNASPSTYWDNTTFTSDQNFFLTYVPGSALLENNGIGANGGVKLSDSVVELAGQLIGYDALDGKVPGCFQYANYVTIKVKANFVDFDYTLDKQVRLAGETEWKDKVEAKVGDTVEFQLTYRNTGNTNQLEVTMFDKLPEGLTYIPGSTMIRDGARTNGAALADGLTTRGVVLGNYAPAAAAYVKFSAKVTANDLDCGNNDLTNVGRVETNGTSKEDSAIVSIDGGECKETPKELPKTGATTTVVSSALGIASVATAGAYFIRSRKNLN